MFGSYLINLFLAVAIFIVGQANASDHYKYYTDSKETRVAEVDSVRNCHIFRREDASWFILTRKSEVKSISDSQFDILQRKCNRIAMSNSTNDTEEERADRNSRDVDTDGGSPEFAEANESPSPKEELPLLPEDFDEFDNITFGTSTGFPLIFPGTKWCGAGDLARSADDVGLYVHTDNCCRHHDICDDNIAKGECKYDLCNDGSFTKSHCKCDHAFLKCLRTDTTLSAVASFKVAHMYFNLLKPDCFDQRHPPKQDECKKRRLTGECVKYNFDYSNPIKWQFFPAQPYEPIQRTVKKLLDPGSLLPGGNILPTIPSPRVPAIPTIPAISPPRIPTIITIPSPRIPKIPSGLNPFEG